MPCQLWGCLDSACEILLNVVFIRSPPQSSSFLLILYKSLFFQSLGLAQLAASPKIRENIVYLLLDWDESRKLVNGIVVTLNESSFCYRFFIDFFNFHKSLYRTKQEKCI